MPANVGGSGRHASRRPPLSPASRLLQGQCPPGNVGIGPGPPQATLLAGQRRPQAEPRPFVGAACLRTSVGQVDTRWDGHRVRQQAGSYRDNVRRATSVLAPVSIESTRWPGNTGIGPGAPQATRLTWQHRPQAGPGPIIGALLPANVGGSGARVLAAGAVCRSRLAGEPAMSVAYQIHDTARPAIAVPLPTHFAPADESLSDLQSATRIDWQLPPHALT